MVRCSRSRMTSAPARAVASIVMLLMMLVTLVNQSISALGLKAMRTTRFVVDSGDRARRLPRQRHDGDRGRTNRSPLLRDGTRSGLGRHGLSPSAGAGAAVEGSIRCHRRGLHLGCSASKYPSAVGRAKELASGYCQTLRRLRPN